MTRKPTSAADATPVRMVIVTLDGHLAGAALRARRTLEAEIPGLELSLHSAVDWADDEEALDRCKADIARGDVILCTMLFMEDHINAVLPALRARREHCDAMIGAMSGGEIIKLTKIGGFRMDVPASGPMKLLKKLRGSASKKDGNTGGGAGAAQMAMLRRIPQILRFIPGKAQDVRAYFLTLQYWLAGSDDNVTQMVRFLIDRYAEGDRAHLRGTLKAREPIDYPEVGLYHPRIGTRLSERLADLPPAPAGCKGTVGLLVMRSYVLAGNTGHYDGVISAFEERGLRVVPAYASGLDSRPAVEKYFVDRDGRPTVDAVCSLTGFSLVGGPAYNDARAAEELLAKLDVPYVTALAVEFQSLETWEASERGLLPVEATMMVAIPELDGATAPMLFGGRSDAPTTFGTREMQAHPERAAALADRVAKRVALRKAARAERKVGVVLFNFPPNAGATGTAAFLSVFQSLHNTLKGLKAAGYTVEVPETADELRARVVKGNAERHGTAANVHARIPVDDHVKRERWLKDIEREWGPAPGKEQTDGGGIFVLGERFGNVFVGIQPAFGYEGDPMRLLFERNFAPTHAFCAFYRWLREDFGAHAVLHFGTHGALEFMPGKQVGLSGACWPDRLIGDLPNLYLYAANNPSEGIIAKRRSGATLISYLTPPVSEAGLHKGLADLKSSIERWRALDPAAAERERTGLAELLQAQAAQLDLCAEAPAWTVAEADDRIHGVADKVRELELTLIPHGLHVVGAVPSDEERVDLLMAVAEASHEVKPNRAALEALVAGKSEGEICRLSGLPETEATWDLVETLIATHRMLTRDTELPALLHALDGGFIRPAPGGDLLRTPEILPTGRNLHGFDPWRLPSAYAVADGRRQAERVLERHRAEGNPLPESIAMVLWGTDNLKSEGGPIGQALALMGAKPRTDGYGRLAGAELVPLEDLGRPRIDVIMTLSGIFRDLLPLQTKLLAEAAWLAATADEPADLNFVRKHALAHAATTGCDLETAALRVFSNAEGAYGSNVNMLIDSGRWNEEDELADTYTSRKCFAYGRDGKSAKQSDLLRTMLADVSLAYQNLESVELGVTTIDHYFDTLGGISKAVSRAKGSSVPVYIGDQTSGDGKVRTLAEQVSLETHTRALNPKWYEAMLEHGYEGVRQIEAHVTNTMGWSATTGHVAPWVYERLTETFLLDEAMRRRLAQLNPQASARVANRLLEAHERNYWTPDEDMLEALRQAGEELEDALEGVTDLGPAGGNDDDAPRRKASAGMAA